MNLIYVLVLATWSYGQGAVPFSQRFATIEACRQAGDFYVHEFAPHRSITYQCLTDVESHTPASQEMRFPVPLPQPGQK